MDKTEIFIKMCDCAEVQEGKPQDGVGGRWLNGSIIVSNGFQSERGDFYHIVDTEDEKTCESCGNTETYIKCTKSTWLPRQDQLQEMVDWTWIIQLHHLYKDCNDNPQYWGQFASWEQLWLAFVMKEKFSKVWAGKEWKDV